MKKGEYFASPKGLVNRYNHLVFNDFNNVKIFTKYFTSKQFSRNIQRIIDFQQQVIGQLKSKRHKTSNIALCMRIVAPSGVKYPLPSMVKAYLDLLGRSFMDPKTSQKFLLYRDDKQIKYLNVDFAQSDGKEGIEINVSFKRLTTLLEEILICKELESEHLDENENCFEYLRDHERYINEFKQYLTDKETLVKKYGKEKTEQFHKINKSVLSSMYLFYPGLDLNVYYYLLNLDARLCSRIEGRAKHLYKGLGIKGLARSLSGFDYDMENIMTALYFKNFLVASIPFLKGSSKLYAKELCGKTREYISKNIVLRECSPVVKVIIAFRPPHNQKFNYSKDLDNIFKEYIFPGLNMCNVAFTGYEIIQLPVSKKYEEGMLAVAFSSPNKSLFVLTRDLIWDVEGHLDDDD